MYKLHNNVKKIFLTDLEIVTPDSNIQYIVLHTAKQPEVSNTFVHNYPTVQILWLCYHASLIIRYNETIRGCA